MAIYLIRGVISNEAGPRSVGGFNVTPTVTADFQLPVAKREARILNEDSGRDEVGRILYRVGRIVGCSTKGAINDVAIIIGREFKPKNITLVRPSEGSRQADTMGKGRHEHKRGGREAHD